MFNARSMFVKQIFKHEGLLDDASSCRSTASSFGHISRDDGLSVILSKVVCDGDGWDQCERSQPMENENDIRQCLSRHESVQRGLARNSVSEQRHGRVGRSRNRALAFRLLSIYLHLAANDRSFVVMGSCSCR